MMDKNVSIEPGGKKSIFPPTDATLRRSSFFLKILISKN